MGKITIANLHNKTIKFKQNSGSLLKILQNEHIDWMHACGGKGRCTTCKLIIEEGTSSFEPLTPFEKKVKGMGKLQENERLACQAIPTDDIIIKVPNLYKLPHLDYSE